MICPISTYIIKIVRIAMILILLNKIMGSQALHVPVLEVRKQNDSTVIVP